MIHQPLMDTSRNLALRAVRVRFAIFRMTQHAFFGLEIIPSFRWKALLIFGTLA
jgi:hypothetical protein